MRFRLIDATKAAIPVERSCSLLHVSVSGYYAWKDRTPSRRQREDMIFLPYSRAVSSVTRDLRKSPHACGTA